MKKFVIILILLLGIMVPGTYQVKAIDLPQGALLGDPYEVPIDLSLYPSAAVWYSDWICADTDYNECHLPYPEPLFRGLYVDVNAILEDYTTTRSYEDLYIHMGNGFSASPCVRIVLGIVCGDTTPYSVITNTDMIDINVELVHIYEPLMVVHADTWYSHEVEFLVTSGSEDITTVQFGTNFGADGAVTFGTSSTHSFAQAEGLNLGWPVVASPGETIYIYNEAIYLRVYGSVQFDYLHVDFMTQESEMFYDEVFEFDVPYLLTEDFTDRIESNEKFGDFPEQGSDYVLIPYSTQPQEYVTLPEILEIEEYNSTTDSFGISLEFGGSYKGVTGGFSWNGFTTDAVNTGIKVKHTFRPSANSGACDSYRIKLQNSWETDIECTNWDDPPNMPNKPGGLWAVDVNDANTYRFYTTDPDSTGSNELLFEVYWGHGSPQTFYGTSGVTQYVSHTYTWQGWFYIEYRVKSEYSTWSDWSPTKSVYASYPDGGGGDPCPGCPV